MVVEKLKVTKLALSEPIHGIDWTYGVAWQEGLLSKAWVKVSVHAVGEPLPIDTTPRSLLPEIAGTVPHEDKVGEEDAAYNTFPCTLNP